MKKANLMLIAGIATGLQIASRDQRLPLVLGMLGGFVLTFAVCAGGTAPASVDDRYGKRTRGHRRSTRFRAPRAGDLMRFRSS